jgi:hypothetical protein
LNIPWHNTLNTFNFSDSPQPIREDLAQAYRSYWQQLAKPGTWWTGAERVAIAAEVRNATHCEFCVQRKQALSPYNFPGEHNSGDSLPEHAIDAVHRIITDQSRITAGFIKDGAEQNVSVERYVELLGIVVTVFSIDEHMRALSLALEPLPIAEEGPCSQYLPEGLETETAMVPMIGEKTLGAKESDLWPPNSTANVLRALSLVPNAVREWFGIGNVQYLSPKKIMSNFGGDTGRAINRMQIELVAARVSSYNECFY